MEHNTFTDDTIFLTGGSGFLGTALVCKIILSTQCPKLILLCRGGLSRILQVWQTTLPPHVFEKLCNNSRIRVLDGDICLKDLGLGHETTQELQQSVSLVIHAASSINLRHNLARIAPIIVQGTLNVANFALGCSPLSKFVYVSTAYANSHRHYLNPHDIPHIPERIHPLKNEVDPCLHAEAEWTYLQEHGTTPEYETTPFPFAYAYAKHLTERLLTTMFRTDDATISETSTTKSTTSLPMSIESNGSNDSIPQSQSRLLIVRPSIIGPAESCPAPGWQVATSAPVTGLLAFLILTPSKKLTFYSALSNPNSSALIDEVPVDIVVNRIIAHTSTSTRGIVHANREISQCHSFGTYVRSIQRLRRLPWNNKIAWDKDPASTKLCMISKLYQVSGCTFDFDNRKTSDLWVTMSDSDKKAFPLFTATGSADRALEMSMRDDAFRKLFLMYFKKKNWPEWARLRFVGLLQGVKESLVHRMGLRAGEIYMLGAQHKGGILTLDIGIGCGRVIHSRSI